MIDRGLANPAAPAAKPTAPWNIANAADPRSGPATSTTPTPSKEKTLIEITSMSSVILARNASFETKSVAWAVNIISPLGTTINKAPSVHGSVWRDSAVTEIDRDNPSSRRSSIVTEPTRVTKPTMCAISTIGYSHSHLRIATASGSVSINANAVLPAGVIGARRSCRRR